MAKPVSTAEGAAKELRDEGKYCGVDAKRQRVYWARVARRAKRRALAVRLRREGE